MYEKEKEELCRICRLLYDRHLVEACDGNVSMRVSEEHILITPSGKNKGFLKAEEILTVDFSGMSVEGKGKASKEFPLHRTVYENRPEAAAVVHTHPVYVTAFAMAGQTIPDNYLIESKVMLGKCALAEYAPPGTPELAEKILPYVKDCNAILLKNHGAVTVGKSLVDAYNKMEVLETIAKTIIMSRLVGEPSPIPGSDER